MDGMSKRRIPRYQRDADEREVALPSRRIIPADHFEQAPNNSYNPPSFYEDKPFVCVDCGKEEVWTARQQKWWYEVAKGSIYSSAIRCRACRTARSARSPEDYQPINSSGALMKLVRAEVDPAIMAAGFAFEARHKSRQCGERAWIDYKRSGQLFSIAFEAAYERPARLSAELQEENGECRSVAVTEFDTPKNRTGIMAVIKAFANAVTEFMTHVGPTP
jgi:hypothetical protein